MVFEGFNAYSLHVNVGRLSRKSVTVAPVVTKEDGPVVNVEICQLNLLSVNGLPTRLA